MRRLAGAKDMQAWLRQPSAPVPTQLAAPTLSFPATFFPPPGSISFYRTGTPGFAVAGPAVGTVIPGTALVLPTNTVGVIRDISFDVNSLLLTSLITFTLRINAAPVEGYTNVTVFPRAVASASLAFDAQTVQVRLPPNALVDIIVNVGDAAAYTLGATYRGWYYTNDIAQQYDPNGAY